MSDTHAIHFPESGELKQWKLLNVLIGIPLGAGVGFGLYAFAISYELIERIDGLPLALILGGGTLGGVTGYLAYLALHRARYEPIEVTAPQDGEIRIDGLTYSLDPRPVLRVERKIRETSGHSDTPPQPYYDVRWLPDGEDDEGAYDLVRMIGRWKHASLREAAEELCRTTVADLVWSHHGSVERRSADELDRSFRERHDDEDADDTETSNRPNEPAGAWFRLADVTGDETSTLFEWPEERCTVECTSDGRIVIDYHRDFLDWNKLAVLSATAGVLGGGPIGAMGEGSVPAFHYGSGNYVLDYAFAITSGMLLTTATFIVIKVLFTLFFGELLSWHIDRVEIGGDTITRYQTTVFGWFERSTTLDVDDIEELHYCTAIGDELYEYFAPASFMPPTSSAVTLDAPFDDPEEHPIRRVLAIGIVEGGAPESQM